MLISRQDRRNKPSRIVYKTYLVWIIFIVAYIIEDNLHLNFQKMFIQAGYCQHGVTLCERNNIHKLYDPVTDI